MILTRRALDPIRIDAPKSLSMKYPRSLKSAHYADSVLMTKSSSLKPSSWAACWNQSIIIQRLSRRFIQHPSNIIKHPSSIIRHPSSIIQHPSNIIRHLSRLIQHPSCSYYPAPVKSYPEPVKTYPAPVKYYPAPVKTYPAPVKYSAPVKAPTKYWW